MKNELTITRVAYFLSMEGNNREWMVAKAISCQVASVNVFVSLKNVSGRNFESLKSLLAYDNAKKSMIMHIQ